MAQDENERLYAHRTGKHFGRGDPFCLLCEMYRRRKEEQPEIPHKSGEGPGAQLDPKLPRQDASDFEAGSNIQRISPGEDPPKTA